MLDNSILENPYKVGCVEDTGMSQLELFLEISLPGFSTINGFFWDKKISLQGN